MSKVLAVLILGFGLVLLPSNGIAATLGPNCWLIKGVGLDDHFIALTFIYDGPAIGEPQLHTAAVAGLTFSTIPPPQELVAISGAAFLEKRNVPLEQQVFNMVGTVGQAGLSDSTWHFQARLIGPTFGGSGRCQAVNSALAAHPCGTGKAVNFLPTACPPLPLP